jgi:subtilisin family serine protease
VWTLRVTGVSVTVGRFHIWLPVTEEVTEKTAFLRSSPDITLTLPSTAENVLSAGGYNSDINGEAAFSGRGFTRTGAVKPDIAAPAVGILTAHSGGGYDVYTGTSMAAPFAAGAAALLMEWGIVRGNDPFLFGQRAKAFLQKGARRTAGAAYPDPVRGWGTLCVRAALDILNDQ